MRGNLTPLPEKERTTQPKKQPQPPQQQIVREASDLDVRRRNKGKVRELTFPNIYRSFIDG